MDMDNHCLLCDQEFDSFDELRNHLHKTHPKEGETSKKTTVLHSKPIRRYECRVHGCESVFSHPSNRCRHETQVHSNHKHTCDICHALFDCHGTLINHQTAEHHQYSKTCDVCGEVFSFRRGMLRHKREQHSNGMKCNQCGQVFKRERGLREHERYEHGTEKDSVTCRICGTSCTNPTTLNVHQRIKHGFQTGGNIENVFKSAFKGYLTDFRYYNDQDTVSRKRKEDFDGQIQAKRSKSDRVEDVDNVVTVEDQDQSDHPDSYNSENSRGMDAPSFFKSKKEHITNDLIGALTEGSVKIVLAFQCLLYKLNMEGAPIESSPVFLSAPETILNHIEIEPAINRAIQSLLKKLENYQTNGSGWSFHSVTQADLHVGRYDPLRSSKFMNLPYQLKNKKTLINIQNDDDFCFVYCIVASIHGIKINAHRVSQYAKYVQINNDSITARGLNLTGMQFPVTLHDIEIFEKNNPDIGVSVYGYTDENKKLIIYPLRTCKLSRKHMVNLLYMSNEDDKSHYVLVTSLSRLLNSKNSHQQHHCPHCLHGFSRSDLLEVHLPYCLIHSSQRIQMPNDNEKKMMFKDGQKQMPIPFIMVADFECSIIQQDNGKDLHTANSFCLYKIDYSGRHMFKPFVYVGKDASSVFATTIEKESNWILENQQKYKTFDKTNMTEQQTLAHEQESICHICKKHLDSKQKVIDHSHHDGLYRGAAHSKCNIRYRVPHKIPLFIHNFSKYDLKVIVDGIRHTANTIHVIPETMETYISMDVNKIRFLDSYRFLDASLESLVEKLRESGEFTHTRRWLMDKGYIEHIDMLLCKNAYPYEWIDDIEKFSYANFPKRPDFYSKIKRDTITQDEYDRALNVYRTLKFTSFKQYHELYLTLDVLLLSDVISSFRKRCLDEDGLDAAHYFTMPNFAFDSMLKSTQVHLELLQDPTMYMMFENHIRGGISVISHRHAVANNPYLPDFDASLPISYIMYQDAVNLYGWAMCQNLPISGFRWLSDEEIEVFDVGKEQIDGEKCYFLEVDLSYPKSVHDMHADYPMAPEAFTVQDDMLSPYCANLKEKLNLGSSTKKLIPNLMSKSKYLCHFRNLQFYLKHGLKITKIHSIIECKQSKWLKPFIELNTDKRKQATNSLDKDFFKKKVNATYGKCEQNPRKYQRVEVTNNSGRVKRLLADPSYLSHKIFFGDDDGESLAAIHHCTTTLKLNKPVYAGFAILELSKLLMFEYFYEYLKPKYGNKIKLCFTDTDSFIFLVFTEDIYKDMQQDQHRFDTADYPHDHFLFSTRNKKIPGKFSDETNSVPIKSFVGLRSKMYSIKLGDGKEKRRAKGIPRRIVQNEITFEHYVKCLESGETTSVQYSSIQAKNMRLYTTTTAKTALSAYDDKRFISNDGISTLPYGHYHIHENVAT